MNKGQKKKKILILIGQEGGIKVTRTGKSRACVRNRCDKFRVVGFWKQMRTEQEVWLETQPLRAILLLRGAQKGFANRKAKELPL